MAAHIIDEIFTRQPHHIVDDVLHKIFRRVPAVALSHVAIYGGKALARGATALDDGLLDHHDPQVLAPVFGLEGRAAASHTAANDEDVTLNYLCIWCCHVAFVLRCVLSVVSRLRSLAGVERRQSVYAKPMGLAS